MSTPETTPPPPDRARMAYQIIDAFGWQITWASDKPVPDDAWPIDIIRRQMEDEVAARMSPLTADARARNFELMLNRIISRHGRGLDIAPTINQARDLVKRTGTGILQREAVDGE